MTSSETPTKKRIRKKKGRGPGTASTTSNNKDATIAKLQLIIDQQQRLLDLFRNKWTRQIAADDNGFGNLEQECEATDAAYNLLWSYGYDTGAMHKAWKALGNWREW